MTQAPPPDTICARATPPGTSAIAIVRLSGPDALTLVDRCFIPHSASQEFLHAKSHTLIFGRFVQPEARVAIDDVLVCGMRGPHSYTGENVVEINCHGSPAIVRRILRVLIDHGARLAEPGEFTRRAFENGQIDLAQAEAVCDLISAQTARAAEISLRQLSGQLSERLGAVRHQTLDLLSEIEAHLDFPEEDLPRAEHDRWLLSLHSVGSEVERLIAGGERGCLLREGARVVIVGKPNAGKSSLFNRLLDQERAIVTAEPGTTRDTLESLIEVEGLPLTVVDTAGLREATSEIERLGVVRTEREITQASLVIFCVPADEPWDQRDEQIWQLVRERHPFVALTKCDLELYQSVDELQRRLGVADVVTTSALAGEGMDVLVRSLGARLLDGLGDDDEDAAPDPLICSERHLEALRHALNALGAGVRALSEPPELELVAADLRAAVRHVDQILGLEMDDEVLDRIFSRFCIGK